MTRDRGDEGVAALEMGLVTILLLLLGFGLLPVLHMASAYQEVNSASAAGVRFATSLDANGRRQADGTLRRRPTAAEVVQLVRDDADDQSLVVTVLVCPYSTPDTCVPGNPSSDVSGDFVKVTVTRSVDLSLLGSVANAVGSLVGQGDIAPDGNVPISSTSSGRQE
jgi:hypothetical protein